MTAPKLPTARPLLTYEEAGEILKMSAWAVTAMCRRGELPRIELSPRQHRIHPDDLDAFIAGHRKSA